MSNQVVKLSDFDVKNVSVAPMKVLDSGGKMAYVNYSSGKFKFQFPSLVLPYGLNIYDKAGPIKYSFNVSLRGYEGENAKTKQLYDVISELDDAMLDLAVKNCRAWFKENYTRDVLKAFYTPMLKFSKDKEGNATTFPPTFKINLKKSNDKFTVAVYDKDKKPYIDVPIEDLIVKGAEATVLLQCGGVWVAGSKFGLSWSALQIRMDSVPEGSSSHGCSIDDDDDLVKTSKTVVSKVAPVAPVAPVSSVEEEDDADEDTTFNAALASVSKPSVISATLPSADDAEDAEDDEPVPVPVKKVITAKKVIKAVCKK